MPQRDDIAFEEVLSEDWSRDLDVVEVPLGERPISVIAIIALVFGLVVGIRIIGLAFFSGGIYANRAYLNLNKIDTELAPRGLILDRNGVVLAENRAAFSLFLDSRDFLKHVEKQEPTFTVLERILGISRADVEKMIAEHSAHIATFSDPIALADDLSQPQLVAIQSLHLSTLLIKHSFERSYPNGSLFSSVLGYTGLLNSTDLLAHPELTGQDLIGKAGLELSYDASLQGTSGHTVQLRNAKGEVIGVGSGNDSHIGASLTTTIDAEFQTYFYGRMLSAFATLGRTTGGALAIDPRNGEVLALLSFPSFDNNVFVGSGKNEEKKKLLLSPLRPLFNRVVSGMYNPGSTIKPLVGIAGLTEGVMTPSTTVFSPGYIDIPNPYDVAHPTRYVDWRYQGYVNLYSAIAQSSNVYFYEIGGGFGDIGGLGITRLLDWWKRFHFGVPVGIDIPGEAKGFLPTPEWKESHDRGSWLLGDTYNVSIGQGDFLVTAVQLLNYIATIAADGKMYMPHLAQSDTPKLISDFSSLLPEIKEVQKGMVQTVVAKLGTAHLLADLPFPVAAKTGSAQVQNNTQENAFFVGYTPVDNPRIAILILIEHSKEGSLNAVPIAKDVLNWYYEHRINKTN